MSYFVSDAMAQAGDAGGGGLLSLLPLILIFVLFYFLLIRPQQKKAKQHKEMVSNLREGDEVVTNGGTLGVIKALDNNFVNLEVAQDVIVKVQRPAIAQLVVMPEGTQVTDDDAGPKKKKKNKSMTT